MQKKMSKIISYKSDPSKKRESLPPNVAFIFKKKYSLCQNFIVLCVETSEIFIKKTDLKNDEKNRKIAI